MRSRMIVDPRLFLGGFATIALEDGVRHLINLIKKQHITIEKNPGEENAESEKPPPKNIVFKKHCYYLEKLCKNTFSTKNYSYLDWVLQTI